MRARICYTVIILTLAVSSMAQESPVSDSHSRFGFTLGGGWSAYSMGNLNDHYFQDFAIPIGLFDQKLGNGPILSGELNYSLSQTTVLDLGVAYFRTTESYASFHSMNYGNGTSGPARVDSDFKTSALAPYLNINYCFPTIFGSISIGGGFLYGFGKGTLTVKAIGLETTPPGMELGRTVYEARASGFGGNGETTAFFRMNRTLTFGLSFGYRYLSTGDLKTDDGDPWVVTFTGIENTMNLDFSGPYIMGVISFAP